MEEPAVLAAIGRVAGLDVVDLGCGDGAFGVDLLAAGCSSYLGIDGSELMVGKATNLLAGTAGSVRRGDLEDLTLPDCSADLVTARLSLHYVADLAPVLACIAKALRPGGTLVMTVVHPVLTSHEASTAEPRTNWLVDDYFDTGPRTRQFLGATVTWHHRTIDQYVQAVLAAGLRLGTLSECAPVADRFDTDTAELHRRRRVPAFLLLTAARD
jgi:SAM-dependent methyltransferase